MFKYTISLRQFKRANELLQYFKKFYGILYNLKLYKFLYYLDVI